MGFNRQLQPARDAAIRAQAVRVFEKAPSIAAILAMLTPADPFGLDHDCLNPTGHEFIASCGEVVCSHCARIAWR